MDDGSAKRTALFQLVVLLCVTEKRAITIQDLVEQTTYSQKTVQDMVQVLEGERRLIKTKVKLPAAKRPWNAWYPVGRVVSVGEQPPSPLCDVCGARPRKIRVKKRWLCRICMRGFEHEGEWVVVGADDESERSFSRASLNNAHHLADHCQEHNEKNNKK